MKKLVFSAAILFAVCCAVLCLCACGKKDQSKRSVTPDTLRLMQKTQAELTACVDRCRSAAAESRDKDFYLALANSQQVLADRHATIINILLRKYKLEKTSTVSYPIEMDPRALVLSPVEEYKDILSTADTKKVLREILITLEITNKVLASDKDIERMIDPDAEETSKPDFHLCPVCGHLSLEKPEENCPVCHSDKDRQIQLKNGELPPREEGTFVIIPD